MEPRNARDERDERQRDDSGASGARSREGDHADDGQHELPLEGPDGQPIGYRLTARARREVAPETLPELELIDPHDARPARARALRRAGRSVEDVAGALGVSVETARGWCGDVVERRKRQPSDRRAAQVDAARRARARDGVESAIGEATDVALAGIVAGAATVTATAVTVTLPDPDLAPPVLGWLVSQADAGREEVRALVAVAPGSARDVVVETWARRLGLSRDRITHSPWREAPEPGAVRVTLRFTDPGLAAIVSAWRDVLAETTPARVVDAS